MLGTLLSIFNKKPTKRGFDLKGQCKRHNHYLYSVKDTWRVLIIIVLFMISAVVYTGNRKMSSEPSGTEF